MLWDDVHGFWLMALAVEDHIKLWKSDDLKSWEHLSDWGKGIGEHGGVWECPDLFPIEVEGSDEIKWVLLQNLNPGAPNGGSGLQYFVGDFDGKNFILDPEFEKSLQRTDSIGSGLGIWLDYGKDNYAGVTWGNIPDDKRYFIGWMSNWEYATVVPTERWRSAMTLPRELKLVHTDAGYRLLNFPVKNLEALRLESFDLEETSLDKPLVLSDAFAITANALEMEVVFEPEGKGNLELELKNNKGERYVFGYDKGKNMFYSDRRQSGKTDFSEAFANRVHWSPRTATDGSLKLHIFLDRASIEVFADGGSTAVTNIFFPTEDYTEVRWTGDGSLKGTVWNLKKK
ncbi:MAG: GH32 C-terminal domain-containing protein [Saprospiraceae bacterium]